MNIEKGWELYHHTAEYQAGSDHGFNYHNETTASVSCPKEYTDEQRMRWEAGFAQGAYSEIMT